MKKILLVLSGIFLLSGCGARGANEGISSAYTSANTSEADIGAPPEDVSEVIFTGEAGVSSEESGAEELPETQSAEPAASADNAEYFSETSFFEGEIFEMQARGELYFGLTVPFGLELTAEGAAVLDNPDTDKPAAFAQWSAEGFYDDPDNDYFIVEHTISGSEELTDTGESFYLVIYRDHADNGVTLSERIVAEGIYPLERGYFRWLYYCYDEDAEREFISDATNSLKSMVCKPRYFGAEGSGENGGTELPLRGEFPDARDYEDKFTLDLSGSGEPQVSEVTVGGADDPRIENLLDVHARHTELAGRFGCPVNITAEGYNNAAVTFRYDRRDMKNVPDNCLILLHYNEREDRYYELPSEVNVSDATVSADITENGVYMLADLYEWYGVSGDSVPEGYAHPLRFVSESAPGFILDVPVGMSLYEKTEEPQEIPRTELTSRELAFSEISGDPVITLGISEISGAGAWDYALDCAENVRNDLDIEGVPWEKLDELENGEDRIVIMKKTPLAEGWLYTVSAFYRYDGGDYISLHGSVSGVNAEKYERELAEFAASFKWRSED